VETIDSSLGRGIHPAFMVDGKEVEEIFIGQANATIIDGMAYSIPGEQAARSVNFDETRESCVKKGKGWHLLNNWEYAALVMYLARKRNRYFEKEWWDWIDGLKIVDGEIFTPGDNNFELPEKDWPSLGVFFDDIKGGPILNNEITHYTEADSKGIEDDRDNDWVMLDHFSKLEWFHNFHRSQIEKLAQMPILPSATPVYTETDGPIWIRNYGTRLPVRGGTWYCGTTAGLAALDLASRRSLVSGAIGCRPAFIHLND
jgi:hypothetical protein